MPPRTGPLAALVAVLVLGIHSRAALPQSPDGGRPPPGTIARYRHLPADGLARSVVSEFSLAVGPVDQQAGQSGQWSRLTATKADGGHFQVWRLTASDPPRTVAEAGGRPRALRYVLQEGRREPVEYLDPDSGVAVLPSLLDGAEGWPRHPGDGGALAADSWGEEVALLGHRYSRTGWESGPADAVVPPPARVVRLRSDRLVGLPSNRRQRDPQRRFDGSDYDYVPMASSDYAAMVEAGMNCLRVDADQLAEVERLDAFYWGVGPEKMPFPECLYRSQYLGPSLFLDEPAVVTRDHVIRPRLAADAAFRRGLSLEAVLEAFSGHFDKVLEEGAPWTLRRRLSGREGVDLGTMRLRQSNLYSWETMVATAAFQLSRDPEVPNAIVFEPPGRIGTRRTIPEWNMTYGCQIPVDHPRHLAAVIYGFLRGAARLTGKAWGTSIYGAVDRCDAPWLLTHAYDLGATRFFFWDNAALACIPFPEALTLARHLRDHAGSHPTRDLARLRSAAEVAILLPPGYNLGHVRMGKGDLWGLDELNLERLNAAGVPYRRVMSAFFTEIERCLRLGVDFDLLWELPDGPAPPGYREVVALRETGEVEVILPASGASRVLPGPRVPARPEGAGPGLEVRLSTAGGPTPLQVQAIAEVHETAAPVYYTHGADPDGCSWNALVAWELFGPQDEDHRHLTPPGNRPQVVTREGGGRATVTFTLDRPGRYRLRVATTDLAGRSTIRWGELLAE